MKKAITKINWNLQAVNLSVYRKFHAYLQRRASTEEEKGRVVWRSQSLHLNFAILCVFFLRDIGAKRQRQNARMAEPPLLLTKKPL